MGLGMGALIAIAVAGLCFKVYRYYSYGEGLGKAKGVVRSLNEKWSSKPQEPNPEDKMDSPLLEPEKEPKAENVQSPQVPPSADSRFDLKTMEGFQVFTVSSSERIFRDARTLSENTSMSTKPFLSAAANEYESFQLVVQSGNEPVKNVSLQFSDLIEEKTKERIDKGNVTWRVVGYVLTQKPPYPVSYVGFWPDPLLEAQAVHVPSGITQPLWVTVYTPKETKPGVYKGNIFLRADGLNPREIPFSVGVYNFILPKISHLKTAFDFKPDMLSYRYSKIQNEEDGAYQQRLAGISEKFLIEMLRYRMNPMLNILPDAEDDLRRLDRYRWFGLNQFALGRYGGAFDNNWPKEETDLEQLKVQYRRYGDTLKVNKMLDQHYVYTWEGAESDNPRPVRIAAMIHEAHPELRNMVAWSGTVESVPESTADKDIDIQAFRMDFMDQEKVKQLVGAGHEVRTYISTPAQSKGPRLVIDSDAMDYRIIPWMCWKYEIKGFLYESVNWWPLTDPFKSAANTKDDENGSGLLFYPGPAGLLASVRSELFRDGMEDYEYLFILKSLLGYMYSKGIHLEQPELYDTAKKLLVIPEEMIKSSTDFNKDGEALQRQRGEVARMIEKIAEFLRK